MADTKISALTASTTPLAGTEVLPIVQSGVTKQVSVANLTAGRAISATQLTLTTGNLIVASGQGIDFSATPGTGTSELLADYEEGTYTATLTPSGGSITLSGSANTMAYTKIGRQVTVTGKLIVSSVSSPTGTVDVNLPFAIANLTGQAAGASGAMSAYFTVSTPLNGFLILANESTSAFTIVTGTSTVHGNSAPQFQADTEVQFTVTYFTS
jgi:hypothetical protein